MCSSYLFYKVTFSMIQFLITTAVALQQSICRSISKRISIRLLYRDLIRCTKLKAEEAKIRPNCVFIFSFLNTKYIMHIDSYLSVVRSELWRHYRTIIVPLLYFTIGDVTGLPEATLFNINYYVYSLRISNLSCIFYRLWKSCINQTFLFEFCVIQFNLKTM